MSGQYLVVESSCDSFTTDTIDDDLRVSVDGGDASVFRFLNGKFQSLVVDGEENDDGDMEWNADKWTDV